MRPAGIDRNGKQGKADAHMQPKMAATFELQIEFQTSWNVVLLLLLLLLFMIMP